MCLKRVSVTLLALGIVMFWGPRASAHETKPAPKQEAKPTSSDAKVPAQLSSRAIPPGSKVYIKPMEGGFDIYLAAGLVKKQVPLVVVRDKSQADYEIEGIAASQQAGWAKILFTGSDAPREYASFKMTDRKTGEVVFAYAVHKENAPRGKQSAAEACAKHLKERIEGK